MRVVFFGTPIFSAEILRFLIQKKMEIVAVVTQPDKEQGRHLKLQQSAVKKMALQYLPGVTLLQPQKIRAENFAATIQSFQADVFVVVAFGQIFPQSLLDMPRLGCINLHTSLLPKYRGAAPIERCLIEGEAKTGVSVMYMVQALDAGDVLAVQEIDIKPHIHADQLTIELCEISKELLYNTLLKLDRGEVSPVPQNQNEVTYAPKVLPQDAEIKWDCPIEKLYHLYQGVTPKPGAWCNVQVRGKKIRLKIIEARPIMDSEGVGELISYDEEGIVVGAIDGALKITKLQLEGKKALCAREFVKGYSAAEISFNSSSLSPGR